MPNTIVHDDTRQKLVSSFALVHANQAAITAQMQRRLQELETAEEPFGQAEVTALMLVQLLIENGNDLAAYGALRDLRPTDRRHREMGITRVHYARFGLALVPVLCTVLGADLLPHNARAWHDAFWRIVRHLESQRESEPEADFAAKTVGLQ